MSAINLQKATTDYWWSAKIKNISQLVNVSFVILLHPAVVLVINNLNWIKKVVCSVF